MQHGLGVPARGRMHQSPGDPGMKPPSSNKGVLFHSPPTTSNFTRPRSIIKQSARKGRPKRGAANKSFSCAPLKIIEEESDLGNLFIINPPSFAFDENEYVFLGLELPQDVTKVNVSAKGKKADVQVCLPSAYFSPHNVVAHYGLRNTHTVLQKIRHSTKSSARRLAKDDPYQYKISFDIPFEIEAEYKEHIHPFGYDNSVGKCQVCVSGTRLEEQWHRSLMMIFKKKENNYDAKKTVGDLKFNVADICSDSDSDY